MAISLAQAALLQTDAMKKGIIDTIINESPFLRRMPFIEVDGNSYMYNLESTEGGADWYLPNEQIVEKTPTWAQRSVVLMELIGDADVDKYEQQTRSKDQNLKAAVIEKKSKAIAQAFEKACIRGYTSTTYSTKELKGLMHLLAECESSTQTALDYGVNDQWMYSGTDAGAVFTMDKLDELIDLIKPGKPDAIIMSRKLRQALNTAARANLANVTHDRDELGFFVTRYGGIEVIVCDWIPDNLQDTSTGDLTTRSWVQATTRTGGYDESIVFALKWGESGICGLHNGGLPIVEELGTLESKDATRTRIKMYVAMANFSKSSLAGYGAVWKVTA